jgi:uncharacterized protein (TIGR02118 family)
MITISILYPATAATRFDFDYYVNTHMPRAIELLSPHPGYLGVDIARGLAGGAPGASPAYIALCLYKFRTVDEFLAAFLPNAPELQGDMANYTNIEPLIQFSEQLIIR